MKLHAKLLIPFSLLMLAGCSGGPATEVKKEPAKPPEPVSGQLAFFQMYGSARTWAQDAQGFTMQSMVVGGIAPEAGKYPAWRVQFVSDSNRAAKTYQYSVVTADGLNEGIFSGRDESYSGPRGQNQPFAVQALKIDSTAAYETALAKGGAEFGKKHPELPVTFLLENTKRFPNPTWRVLWGESVGTSNFSIIIDATTGDYLQTMH